MASASDFVNSSKEGSLPPFDKFLSKVGKGALIRSSNGSSPLTSEQRGTIRAGLKMVVPNPMCNVSSIEILSVPAQGVPLSEDGYNPSPQRSFSKASDQGTVNERGIRRWTRSIWKGILKFRTSWSDLLSLTLRWPNRS
ncbi:hypothetical protein U1Q18_009794 [Sarracenia purpurea var. burkii]